MRKIFDNLNRLTIELWVILSLALYVGLYNAGTRGVSHSESYSFALIGVLAGLYGCVLMVLTICFVFVKDRLFDKKGKVWLIDSFRLFTIDLLFGVVLFMQLNGRALGELRLREMQIITHLPSPRNRGVFLQKFA